MSKVAVFQAERPRNVNVRQAAAILYGDWGTSKVYIIGLAFALAAHSSFWLILAVSLLNILVGLNYILICKYYPNGGGVYASVRHRSEILALLGAFFLLCDYMITMAISAVSAFSYVGVDNPNIWAMIAIAGVAILNFFGPRHMGNLAFLVATSSAIVVFILGMLVFPSIGQAWSQLKPFEGGVGLAWIDFVGVVVALSGVEAIANMTGVMKLDPGSTSKNPSVFKTSTPAIIAVMLEVSFFTTLFSLAVNLLPGLVIHGDEVSAPGYPNVRDSMLRYMSESYCAPLLSEPFCHIFGIILTVVFGTLLVSAVNTALIASSSLLYVMAKDGQIPGLFSIMNRFGVPKVALLVSALAPIAVLAFIHDMLSLANLYAIGFVGAIATNMGSTSTDSLLPLKKYERIFMFSTFLLMMAIEITLFIEKPHARMFVITVIAIGLLLRGLVQEKRNKHEAVDLTFQTEAMTRLSKEAMITQGGIKTKGFLSTPLQEMPLELFEPEHLHSGSILCAVTHVGKSLEFALQWSRTSNQKLFVLFIREQRTMVQQDEDFFWLDDQQACEAFEYALTFFKEPSFTYLYTVSDLPAVNIVEYAKSLNVSNVVLGMSRKHQFWQMLRGDVVTQVFKNLPAEIDLIIVS